MDRDDMYGPRLERYAEQYRQARITWFRAEQRLLECKKLLVRTWMRWQHPGLRYEMMIDENNIRFDFTGVGEQKSEQIGQEVARMFDGLDEQAMEYIARMMDMDDE